MIFRVKCFIKQPRCRWSCLLFSFLRDGYAGYHVWSSCWGMQSVVANVDTAVRASRACRSLWEETTFRTLFPCSAWWGFQRGFHFQRKFTTSAGHRDYACNNNYNRHAFTMNKQTLALTPTDMSTHANTNIASKERRSICVLLFNNHSNLFCLFSAWRMLADICFPGLPAHCLLAVYLYGYIQWQRGC